MAFVAATPAPQPPFPNHYEKVRLSESREQCPVLMFAGMIHRLNTQNHSAMYRLPPYHPADASQGGSNLAGEYSRAPAVVSSLFSHS